MHVSYAKQACKDVQNLNIRSSEFADLVGDREQIVVCDWYVADHYRIVGGWIYPDGKWQEYFPLEDPHLFISFARLGSHGESSDASILRWVSKYGLLTREHEDKPRWWDEGETNTRKRTWIVNQSAMPAKAFRAEVERAYGLLTLYAQIREMDWDGIQARIDNPSSLVDQALAQEFEPRSLHKNSLRVIEQDPSPPDLKYPLSLRVGLYFARNVLAKSLADALARVRLRPRVSEGHPLVDHSQWDLQPPRGLVQSWDCPDLLSAIYLQFYLLVTDNKPIHQCENPVCGMPLPVTRKGKRFCNATCRSSARYYRSR